jgi:hypothetical protein
MQLIQRQRVLLAGETPPAGDPQPVDQHLDDVLDRAALERSLMIASAGETPLAQRNRTASPNRGTSGSGEVRFSIPAGLRRQLSGVAPGTMITITYMGRQDGRKMFQVTTP